MLYPAHIWDCCHATAGQMENFPLTPGNRAAALMDLLGFETPQKAALHCPWTRVGIWHIYQISTTLPYPFLSRILCPISPFPKCPPTALAPLPLTLSDLCVEDLTNPTVEIRCSLEGLAQLCAPVWLPHWKAQIFRNLIYMRV